MWKVLVRAALAMAVLGCVVLPVCQPRTSASIAGVVGLIKAIQETDQKRAGELADFGWRPIFDREGGLSLTSKCCFPIHVAAQEGRVAILEELIRMKADIDARDAAGWTPVAWTFYLAPVRRKPNQLECLRLLARSGANLVARSTLSRETALHLAADGANVEFLRELVKLGADMQARSRDGSTPLHMACKYHSPGEPPATVAIAKILIEVDTDVQTKDKAGQTTEDLARKEGREQLAALLKDASAKKALNDP